MTPRHSPYWTREAVDTRGRAKHGGKWCSDDLADEFWPYLGTDTRIRVTRTYADGQTWTRTGRVGITTGRVPPRRPGQPGRRDRTALCGRPPGLVCDPGARCPSPA